MCRLATNMVTNTPGAFASTAPPRLLFCKQKTSYEMRISDWSSDVCSSGLGFTRPDFTNYIETAPVSALGPILWLEADRMKTLDFNPVTLKIGRASCRERVCQYV